MSEERPTATADVRLTVEFDPQTTSAARIAEVLNKLFDEESLQNALWPDDVVSPEHGSPGVGLVTATQVPDDLWQAHPDYPFAQWMDEVAEHDTVLGYWDWVAAQQEAANG